jgi:hypothetical protein
MTEEDFTSVEDATQEQVDAALNTAENGLHKFLKAPADYELMAALCSQVGFDDPGEGLRLIRSLIRMMADQIGYTERGMAKLLERNGLRCLRPEKLKMVLLNQQRMTPNARVWIRERTKIEKKEHRDAKEEKIECASPN